MTASHVRSHTSGQEKVSDATLALAIDASNASVAGNLLVVRVAFDNLTTSTPTVSSISKPGGESATWRRLASHGAFGSSAASGVRGEMWAIKTTVAWAASTTVTVTLSASVSAKAGLLDEYSGVDNTDRSTPGTQTTQSSVSVSTTGTAPQTGDLVLAMADTESTAGNLDATDSVTAETWRTPTEIGTSGGSGATNISVGGTDTVDASGHITYTPVGTTGDAGGIIACLQQSAAGPINYNETGRQVNITATATETDQVDFEDPNRTVDIAATITVTDGIPYDEPNRPVDAASTITTTDEAAAVEAVEVTITSDVTSTDTMSGAPINYDETGRAIDVAATATAADVAGWEDLIRTVDATATITSGDDIAGSELAALDSAATITSTDDTAGTEPAAVTITATISSTDSMTGAPNNYDETVRIVTIAATTTGTDQARIAEPATVTISSTTTSTDRADMADAATVVATATVTAADLLTYAEQAALDILATITSSDRPGNVPTPLERTMAVAAESRVDSPVEGLTAAVADEPRTLTVPAQIREVTA